MSLNYSSEQQKIHLADIIAGTEEQARNYVTGILCYNSNLEDAILDVTVLRDLVPKTMITTDDTLNPSESIPTAGAIKNYIIANGTQGPQGPQGFQGEPGEQGPQGDVGPQGIAGTSVTILGELADISELPPTGEAGDSYLIGGDLYVWVGIGQGDHGTPNDAWNNVGTIQGPQGVQGATGAQGPVGSIGPQGVQGESGANITWDQLKKLLYANGFLFDNMTKSITCEGGFYQECIEY